MEWTEATHLYSLTFKEALEIIDDATCHGFHFKYENGKFYYSQDEPEHTFVHNLFTN